MKLKIKLSEWYRGKGSGSSALVVSPGCPEPDDVGKMCCLGFLGEACGISREEMMRIPHFADLFAEQRMEEIPKVLRSLVELDSAMNGVVCSSGIASRLIEVNDLPDIPEDERQLTIKELMAEIEVDVEYID